MVPRTQELTILPASRLLFCGGLLSLATCYILRMFPKKSTPWKPDICLTHPRMWPGFWRQVGCVYKHNAWKLSNFMLISSRENVSGIGQCSAGLENCGDIEIMITLIIKALYEYNFTTQLSIFWFQIRGLESWSSSATWSFERTLCVLYE